MIIKTQYEVDQTIFFFNRNEIHSDIVNKIEIEINDKFVLVYYRVSACSNSLKESTIGKSKKELIKKLTSQLSEYLIAFFNYYVHLTMAKVKKPAMKPKKGKC